MDERWKNRHNVVLYENDCVTVKYRSFKLKGTVTDFGTQEQFSQVIDECRKTLYPVMNSFKDSFCVYVAGGINAILGF